MIIETAFLGAFTLKTLVLSNSPLDSALRNGLELLLMSWDSPPFLPVWLFSRLGSDMRTIVNDIGFLWQRTLPAGLVEEV